MLLVISQLLILYWQIQYLTIRKMHELLQRIWNRYTVAMNAVKFLLLAILVAVVSGKFLKNIYNLFANVSGL